MNKNDRIGFFLSWEDMRLLHLVLEITKGVENRKVADRVIAMQRRLTDESAAAQLWGDDFLSGRVPW